jgi:two-component system chemotaxis response regulator CheB
LAEKIKILIIDDSVLARESLKKAFSTDPELEVIATANDPYEAVRELRKNVPDVITLDLHMPRMDGLTFLKKLMQQHPIPVVVISSMTQSGRESAIKALEYGAAEVITKPRIVSNNEFNENSQKLCRSIKAASKANISILKRHIDHNRAGSKQNIDSFHPNSSKLVIAMGASTGGT